MQEACEQCGNEMVALCPVCLDAEKSLPAMPASVRELVEAATAAADGFCYGVAATGCTSDDPDIKANANRCIGEIHQIRERVERAIASVEAHYEKGGR